MKNNRGITLVEMLIVFAVMGVVISIGYNVLDNNTIFSSQQMNIAKDNQAKTIIETYIIKDIESSESVEYNKNENKYEIKINDKNIIEYIIDINSNKELNIVRKQKEGNKVVSEVVIVEDIKVEDEKPFSIDKNEVLGKENYTVTFNTKKDIEPYTIQVASKKVQNTVVSDAKYLTLEGPYNRADDPKYPTNKKYNKEIKFALASREQTNYINGSVAIPIDVRGAIGSEPGALDDNKILYKPYLNDNKNKFNTQYKKEGDDRYPSSKTVLRYDVNIKLFPGTGSNDKLKYKSVELNIDKINYSNGDIVNQDIKKLTRIIDINKKNLQLLQFDFDDETKISDLTINGIGLHPTVKDDIQPAKGEDGYRGYRITGIEVPENEMDIKFSVSVEASKTKDPDQRLGVSLGNLTNK